MGKAVDRDAAAKLVTGLFEQWYSRLVGYALRATGSLDVAEDLVQETLMLLYRDLCRGQAIENPKAWTLSVMRRKITSQIQPERNRALSFDSAEVLDSLPAAPLCSVDSRIESDEVRTLFSVLTRREEEVILLRMQTLKYREIADHLGISPKTVCTLLARALGKLHQAATSRRVGEPVAKHVEKRTKSALQ